MTCASARLVLPRACAPARARMVIPARVRRNVRVASAAGDSDTSKTPDRKLQLEKADALREEYDGVSTRAKRLLSRGQRLAEKIDTLTAGAERAMGLGADRDENQARQLLRERAQVKEALDRTIARAEVLKELASKIEIAIIVLEREAYEGERSTAEDASQVEIIDLMRSTPNETSTSTSTSSTPRLGSLETEFANLEINVLERAFAASGGDSDFDSPAEPMNNSLTSESTDSKRKRSSPSDGVNNETVPGWWIPATNTPDDDDETTNESHPENGELTPPLDALLALDRSRVSSVGVTWKDAMLLRCTCAVHGSTGVSISKRLEGGKRDTAYRAAVDGALMAVERENENENDKWTSTANQAPLHYLSDFARDLGLRPARAGALLTEAVVRRVETFLVQCAAFLRAGDMECAERESETLVKTLVQFADSINSFEDEERLQLVFLRIRKQLKQEEQFKLFVLFEDKPDSVRTAMGIALGRREASG